MFNEGVYHSFFVILLLDFDVILTSNFIRITLSPAAGCGLVNHANLLCVYLCLQQVFPFEWLATSVEAMVALDGDVILA